MDRIEPAVRRRAGTAHARYELRQPVRPRRHGARVREEAGASVPYEDEDQSATGVRVGMRVRHKQFGVGTVWPSRSHGDDYKITVRFTAVGTKKLLREVSRS